MDYHCYVGAAHEVLRAVGPSMSWSAVRATNDEGQKQNISEVHSSLGGSGWLALPLQ